MLRVLTNLTFLFQAIKIPLIYSLLFIELPKNYTKVSLRKKKSPLSKAIGFMPKILNKYGQRKSESIVRHTLCT